MLMASMVVGARVTAGLKLSGGVYGIDTTATFAADASLVPSGGFVGIDPANGAGYRVGTDVTAVYGLI